LNPHQYHRCRHDTRARAYTRYHDRLSASKAEGGEDEATPAADEGAGAAAEDTEVDREAMLMLKDASIAQLTEDVAAMKNKYNDFDIILETISHVLLSPTPPATRRVTCPNPVSSAHANRPMLTDADWYLPFGCCDEFTSSGT